MAMLAAQPKRPRPVPTPLPARPKRVKASVKSRRDSRRGLGHLLEARGAQWRCRRCLLRKGPQQLGAWIALGGCHPVATELAAPSPTQRAEEASSEEDVFGHVGLGLDAEGPENEQTVHDVPGRGGLGPGADVGGGAGAPDPPVSRRRIRASTSEREARRLGLLPPSPAVAARVGATVPRARLRRVLKAALKLSLLPDIAGCMDRIASCTRVACSGARAAASTARRRRNGLTNIARDQRQQALQDVISSLGC